MSSSEIGGTQRHFSGYPRLRTTPLTLYKNNTISNNILQCKKERDKKEKFGEKSSKIPTYYFAFGKSYMIANWY